MVADRLGEVGDDDRLGVDHRVAERLGLRARRFGDPHGGQPERGLDGRDAVELADRVAGIERELVAGQDLAARDLGAAHLQDVLVRRERPPRRGCARTGSRCRARRRSGGAPRSTRLQQRAAGRGVDEVHEAEADRELERVDLQRVARLVAGRRRRRDRRLLLRRGWPASAAACSSDFSMRPTRMNSAPTTRNGSLGRPGHEREQADDDAGDHRGLALLHELARRRRIRGRTPRPLRVTMMPAATEMSSAGICATRPSPTVSSEKCCAASPIGMPCCIDADDDAADEVDRRDDDRGDRVALDELRGAVHRAVEVGLLGDVVAPLARLLLGDLPGVEVGVDRHLLARHGVEGEAGGDLGDAAGAVGDHHELDDDEDEEDDEADDDVAADDELAERLDDVAGVALEQDQPRDTDS